MELNLGDVAKILDILGSGIRGIRGWRGEQVKKTVPLLTTKLALLSGEKRALATLLKARKVEYSDAPQLGAKLRP